MRHEVQRIESLDPLNETSLVRRYRELKHGLGNLFFEPELLLAIQETNLAFKNRIHKLYRQEEQRIVAEYQRVFELEREVPVDRELDRELAEFREEIERFEKQLQSEEFRWRHRPDPPAGARPPAAPDRRPARAAGAGVSRRGWTTGEHALTAAAPRGGADAGAPRGAAGGVLPPAGGRPARDQPPTWPPSGWCSSRSLPPAPRAARGDAYRRLFGRERLDRELEQFLLEAAALRMRINEEAQEITSILDETSVTGDAPSTPGPG